jgi:hypothetical protein
MAVTLCVHTSESFGSNLERIRSYPDCGFALFY